MKPPWGGWSNLKIASLGDRWSGSKVFPQNSVRFFLLPDGFGLPRGKVFSRVDRLRAARSSYAMPRSSPQCAGGPVQFVAKIPRKAPSAFVRGL